MAKNKIMVVDDEPHMLELVKAVLESEGFDTVTASSGQEAIETLKKEKDISKDLDEKIINAAKEFLKVFKKTA